jgi:hypothetical protein
MNHDHSIKQREMEMKHLLPVLVGVLLTLWVGTALADDTRFAFSNLTVKDKRTGLIWARDANLGGGDLNMAYDLLKELNIKNYAGFKDWRLPSLEELKSLLDFAKDLGFADWDSTTHRPYHLFNQMGFYDVQTSSYWSSTTDEKHPEMGSGVGMEYGEVGLIRRSTLQRVWPVRDENRK